MIFKSRQVNLDPEPWSILGASGEFRQSVAEREGTPHFPGVYAPRPEFEPTRDPEPWACQALHDKGSCGKRAAQPYQLDRVGRAWAPRREQFDTPVNPILSGFRFDVEDSDDMGHDVIAHAKFWLSLPEDGPAWDATPEQIDHARRVLTRLAEWKA